MTATTATSAPSVYHYMGTPHQCPLKEQRNENYISSNLQILFVPWIYCYKLYKRTSTGRHTSAIPYNTTMSPSPPMLTSNNVIQFFLNHHVIYHSFRPCSPFNLHLYSLYKGTNFSQLKSTFMPSL